MSGREHLTPPDLLVRGLGLGPLPNPPVEVPGGACCAVTGKLITRGYPVADMTTEATAEFLDFFRGGMNGYVAEETARCIKINAAPSAGNPTARATMVFADGTYYNPLISTESAAKQERPCWSQLVREIWPARAGQPVLIILTTDMKKRLWPRARVGALGNSTPVLYYDSKSNGNEVFRIDWPEMLRVLDLVEEVYSKGFSKAAIVEGLPRAWKATLALGLGETIRWDRQLAFWRGSQAFQMAVLIAQKHEEAS